MTQLLIDKLIAHYEATIKEIEINPKDWGSIISVTYTNKGICYCANNIFKEFIYCDKWIKSLINPSGYITNKPLFVNDHIQAIERLQIRIDVMKTFKED
jgi:hypothetical protein